MRMRVTLLYLFSAMWCAAYAVVPTGTTFGTATIEEAVATTSARANTTVPDTTVPDTTVPDTTVPDTTLPDTTVPDTTLPTTTASTTTVPATTTPAGPSPTTAETGNCCPGYTGGSCDTEDLCHGVVCNNGGTCDAGTGVCSCPSGFDGPTCSYLDCGSNGMYNPATGACMCMAGWTGSNCATCANPSAADRTYLCIPVDATIYLLVPVPDDRVAAYLAGEHRAQGSPVHPPIHTNSQGHDGAQYDCGCHRVNPLSRDEGRKIPRLTQMEIDLFNMTIIDCIASSSLMMSEMDKLNDLWLRQLDTEINNTVGTLRTALIAFAVSTGVLAIALVATCMACFMTRTETGVMTGILTNINDGSKYSTGQMQGSAAPNYGALPTTSATQRSKFSVASRKDT